MSRRVLIAGGGTGGHIFPGLAVADALLAQGVDVHWLGARRGLESRLVAERKLPLTLLDIEGMHARSLTAGLRALGQLPQAITDGFRLVLKLQPMAVLGVGGYASASGIMAAGLLGIPWILQEQNSVPGWTNKTLAPWADLVCCGFADALSHFPSMPAVWTGNPVRSAFFEVPVSRPAATPRLLILGGSQGSLFLNRTLPRALAVLRDQEQEVTIRHQSGSRWHEVVRTAYSDLGLKATVDTFLAQPWEALEWADLVVARSGALTISELSAAGRASLLIPFAAAAGNHQEFNARSLERAGGAEVLVEGQAEFERVASVLTRLLGTPERLAKMGQSARSVALPGAAEKIANHLLSIGGEL